MSEYDDLLTDNQDWLRSFSASLKIPEDWSAGQLALWPIDDLLGAKTYVPCPDALASNRAAVSAATTGASHA